jgi:hypothetical protein
MEPLALGALETFYVGGEPNLRPADEPRYEH